MTSNTAHSNTDLPEQPEAAEPTDIDRCVDAFEAARKANVEYGDDELKAYFAARSWTLNTLVQQEQLGTDRVKLLIAFLAPLAPDPSEENIRAYLQSQPREVCRAAVRRTVSLIKTSALPLRRVDELCALARKYYPPRGLRQYQKMFDGPTLKKPCATTICQMICKGKDHQEKGELLSWLEQAIVEHLKTNMGWQEDEAKGEANAWIEARTEEYRQRELRDSMPRPPKKYGRRPSTAAVRNVVRMDKLPVVAPAKEQQKAA